MCQLRHPGFRIGRFPFRSPVCSRFLEKKEGFDAASNNAIAAESCFRFLLDVERRYEVITENGWSLRDEERPSDQSRAIFWNPCHEYVSLYWPFHLHASSAHWHGPSLKALFWNFMLGDQNSETRQFMYWVDLIETHDKEHTMDGRHNADRRLCKDYVSRLHYGVCKPANFTFVASAWNFCDVLQYCISMDSHVVHLKSSSFHSTPLHLACQYGNVEGAKLLLDNGAVMEVMHRDTFTPMLAAIENGHTAIVRLLLERGANPNSQLSDRYGSNLFMAAECDSIDTVKTLLDAGADPDWGGEFNKTALNMANLQRKSSNGQHYYPEQWTKR